MTMSRKGLLFKIVLTLLLVPALIYLARVGVADFLRLEPCAYVEALMRGSESYNADEFAKARERLLLAHSWDSGNPVIQEFLGHTDLISAQLSGIDPVQQAGYLRQAVDDFDRAIALRPNSSYLWASRMTVGSWLLGLNAKLGRDKEHAQSEFARIELAINRAAVLGPWEPAVLKQIVRVGTFRYQEFSPEDRQIIDGAVTRAKQLGINI